MPITDLGSNIITGQEVVAHWTDVDADRVANMLTALKLPGNYGLSNFSTDLVGVQTAIYDIDVLDNAFSLATGRRDSLRDSLRGRIIELREAVNFRMKDSEYLRTLPDTPASTASEQKLLKALKDMEDAWSRINAATGVPNFTAPLVLRGGYLLAAFQDDLVDLQAEFAAVTNAENDLRIGRNRRDKTLSAFRDRMVEYRQAVQVEYGDEHVFTQTLPVVYESSGPSGGETGPAPAVPGLPTLTILDPTSILVQWTAVPLATSCRVERLVVGQELEFTEAETVTTTFATLTSLPPGEVVRVRLVAINNEAESAPGPHAEITLPAPPP